MLDGDMPGSFGGGGQDCTGAAPGLERVLGQAAEQLRKVPAGNMPEGLALVDFVLRAGCGDPDRAPFALLRALGLTAVCSRSVRLPRPGGDRGRRPDDRVSLLAACGREEIGKAVSLVGGLDGQALGQAGLIEVARVMDPGEKLAPGIDRGAGRFEVQIQLVPGRRGRFPLKHFREWALARGMEPQEGLGRDMGDGRIWSEPVRCPGGILDDLAGYAFVIGIREVTRINPVW
ncbi:MAG: hypothetical protein LBQ79_08700 [Deltaproteobacteria bacterium]|jgi:hypothetical protein|nr:hypothetical protein [Deltaproteobacteria bacterium]